MKISHLAPFAGLMLATLTASAKTLEITVRDVRNNKGTILVMAKVAGQEQPLYGKATAKAGKVVVTLESIDADAAEVSLFHDEDGDYQMKMGDRGPVEGYATKKCKLPQESNTVSITLYYPTDENR